MNVALDFTMSTVHRAKDADWMRSRRQGRHTHRQCPPLAPLNSSAGVDFIVVSSCASSVRTTAATVVTTRVDVIIIIIVGTQQSLP
jgi:hypothetical protein